MEAIKKFVRGEEGQDMVEYALIGALVSIAAIVMIRATGPLIQGIWTDINTALTP